MRGGTVVGMSDKKTNKIKKKRKMPRKGHKKQKKIFSLNEKKIQMDNQVG